MLIGPKNYMTRHWRMRSNEQFNTEGCGIMIDGDDDVWLHYRDGCNDLLGPDRSEYGPAAEVHYMTSDEFDSIGRVTDCGRGGSKLG